MDIDISEERSLIIKVKAGSEHAFRLVYEAYHDQLFRIALRYLRSPDLAEDAVHDVYIKLWDFRSRLDPDGSLKGFLMTTIRNHVLNQLTSKKEKVKKHIMLEYERKQHRLYPGDTGYSDRYKEHFEEAVGLLSDRRREIFKLRNEDGLTNEEIADYLGISEHTVKSQYFKATTFIRNYVSEKQNTQTGS